jgi:hypothetical protein
MVQDRCVLEGLLGDWKPLFQENTADMQFKSAEGCPFVLPKYLHDSVKISRVRRNDLHGSISRCAKQRARHVIAARSLLDCWLSNEEIVLVCLLLLPKREARRIVQEIGE